MNLYEILIPINDNEGVRFSDEHNEQFYDYVIDLAGGLSIWPELPELNMVPLRIACDNETFEQIVPRARNDFRQLSIMSRVVSNEVHFL